MVFGLSINVIIVERKMKKNNQITIKANGIFVTELVTPSSVRSYCHSRNITLGRVAEMRHINDIAKGIQKGLGILKQGNMQEKETQREAIPLRSGQSLKENIIIAVLYAVRKNLLRKTILYLYQIVVQTISQTFNHYAEIAIVKNGNTGLDYFNPELLKGAD